MQLLMLRPLAPGFRLHPLVLTVPCAEVKRLQLTGNNMKRKVTYLVYLLTLLIAAACKTPYTPAPTTAVTNYLVVEGLINISDSTYIKLSRTVNISSSTTTKPEL